MTFFTILTTLIPTLPLINTLSAGSTENDLDLCSEKKHWHLKQNLTLSYAPPEDNIYCSGSYQQNDLEMRLTITKMPNNLTAFQQYILKQFTAIECSKHHKNVIFNDDIPEEHSNKLLSEKGLSIIEEENILSLAIRLNEPFYIEMILSQHTHLLNRIDQHGLTPLHYAAANNQHRIIKKLLDHGAYNPFAGRQGIELAKNAFNTLSLKTIWILTEKKSYSFNPHRHVKIWLSKNPDVFLTEENQLRLVRMRAACPGDEINFIYDSQLLSETSINNLLIFCSKNNLNSCDLNALLPLCKNPLEKRLIRLYNDEIFNLNDGGNLAAASDILRWLKPIYDLGTYSDFDVVISTKKLQKKITVFEEILLNAGTLIHEVKPAFEELLTNNDIIAVVNPNSKKIYDIRMQIINACARTNNHANLFNFLHKNYPNKPQFITTFINELRLLTFNKTPREFRANIPNILTYMRKYIGTLLTQDISIYSSDIPSGISELLHEYLRNQKGFAANLYKYSVIQSTGPCSIKRVLEQPFRKNMFNMDCFIGGYFITSYQSLSSAFHSSQNLSMHLRESDLSQHCKGGDLSWMEQGLENMQIRAQRLNQSATKIQRAWQHHLLFKTSKSLMLTTPISDSSLESVESLEITKTMNYT